MRIQSIGLLLAVLFGSTLLTQTASANCNERADMPGYPMSTGDYCDVGDSEVHFSWGWWRDIDDSFRPVLNASCSGGDCGGQAVIFGFAADGTPLCSTDWTRGLVFCPDDLAYVIYATLGDFE